MCHGKEEGPGDAGQVRDRRFVHERSESTPGSDDARGDVVGRDLLVTRLLPPDVVADQLDQEGVAARRFSCAPGERFGDLASSPSDGFLDRDRHLVERYTPERVAIGPPEEGEYVVVEDGTHC